MVNRLLIAALALATGTAAKTVAAPVLAPPAQLGADLQQYVKVPAGRTALAHVRVIDGTGAAPLEDQPLLIDGARIAAVQPGTAAIPSSYSVLDLSGASVMPGIVGMH